MAYDIPFSTTCTDFTQTTPYVEDTMVGYDYKTNDVTRADKREQQGETKISEFKCSSGNHIGIEIKAQNDFSKERQKILQSASERLPLILNVMSEANKKLGRTVGAEINEMRSLWYQGINHGKRYA